MTTRDSSVIALVVEQRDAQHLMLSSVAAYGLHLSAPKRALNSGLLVAALNHYSDLWDLNPLKLHNNMVILQKRNM